jgi:glycerophosphoryl diester phosphodiesterase
MASRPLLLGHRGARAVKAIPENTSASFDLALAHGCDGFEFDVRLAADGEAVVCHDAKTQEIEIARASAESLPHLPHLREVLARYQRRAFLDIELKVPGLEKITAKLLREFPPSAGYVVSSFLPEVLRAIHAEDSAIPLGLICEITSQLDEWSRVPVTHVMIHQRLALLSTIRALQSAGKKVVVWTVNGARVMQRLAKWGVDGIVSDDTERLVRTLGPSQMDQNGKS